MLRNAQIEGRIAQGGSAPISAPWLEGMMARGHKLTEEGRCRFHRGLSTGPKTKEGKARIAAAQRRRWAK
jgi:hypothetical protein